MENKTNTTGTVTSFKKMTEMSESQILNCPKFNCDFVRELRRGSIIPTYQGILTIGVLHPRMFITEAAYIKISRKLGHAEVPKQFRANVRIQLSKGKRKDDSYYYMAEIYLGKGMIESFFFDNNQADVLLMDKVVSKLFIERPENDVEAATTELIG